MITTILLAILNFVWYGFFDLLWIKEIPFLSLITIQSIMNWISKDLLPIFRIINIVLPLTVIFYCVLGIMTLYFVHLTIKVIRFLIQTAKP